MLAVVGYHLALPAASGGYLGVDLFFVLSGFLITSLLVDERTRTGRSALGAFWGRRARRLFPALLVLLVAVTVAAAAGLLVGVTDLGALRGDALATLLYVANWHALVAGQSYFAKLAAPSPLAHTWSLAIEEQFYVLWPPLLALGWWVSARRHPSARVRNRMLATATLAAAVASATWMGWMAAHGASPDRLYYGTDTRAFELLAGAALALAVTGRDRPGRSGRAALHVGAVVAGAVLLTLLCTTVAAGASTAAATSPPKWVFEGGMALFCLAAVVVVADVGWVGTGPTAAALRLAPVRFLGRISYALYLWHWPVITQLTPARTGLGGVALDAVRLAVAGALALASTFLLEEPIRRAARRRRSSGATRAAPRSAVLRGAGLTAMATAAVAVCIVVGTLPVGPAAAAGPAASGSSVPGAGGISGEPRLDLATAAASSPADPLRVTLVGDSVMWVQAPALTAALKATGAAVVTDMAFPGWGLSTDHTWVTGVPAMLERTRPDVVVATWSWDDDWVLSDPAGYRAALERFIGLLLDPGRGVPGARAVVLEEFPPLGPPPGGAGAAAERRRVAGDEAWNAMIATMPERFPGRVLYAPVAASVESDGHYATWLRQGTDGPWVRVRSVDETHFCPAGAARYSAALVADLHVALGLRAAGTSWWRGSWQHDTVYRSPPGNCPADGPQSVSAASS